MEQKIIETRALSKTYLEGERAHVILDQLNAEIYRGEILILLGRSGSGKSTLLNLISGIDLPNGGDIIVDGKNLTRLSERERTLFRRKHMGVIFQFFNLIPTLTVLENVLLPLELNGDITASERKKALDLLAEVGLANRANTFPDRLSGGEQQRVAIARALIHEPLIVLADEPTGNLDYETGTEIIALLDRLVRQKGKTLVMATHSKEVIGLADRIFTIRDGKMTQTNGKEIPWETS